jgi:hypothetical protein
MDDRLSYEKQRPASKHYLTDALDSVIAGQPVKVAKADGVGCLVNFPERDNKTSHAKISYSEQIGPMLVDKCTACHQTGGVGPWAMTSYDMVKGFAPMIREVVRTQRMPPWHADPHYGVWQNSRALTDDQRKLLVHWIEAGAPRGSGPDPLLKVKPDTSEWKHGKPDLVVEIPAYDIPATGVIEYQYPKVKNPLGRDVWITAVEIHPGAKQAIHHIIAQDPVVLNGSSAAATAAAISRAFAPGMSPVVYPPTPACCSRRTRTSCSRCTTRRTARPSRITARSRSISARPTTRRSIRCTLRRWWTSASRFRPEPRSTARR